MGNNPTNNPIDPELEKAKKSMGWRIDPDEVKTEDEPKVDEPAKVDPPAIDPVDPPKDDVTVGPKDEDTKKIERPESYIPMPKYLHEKKDWETKVTTVEEQFEKYKTETEAKITELTNIVSQKDGAQKDDDIEAFVESTGFDRETVEGLIKLTEKRLSKGESITPEEKEAVMKANAIVKEAEMEQAFNVEFTTVGEPFIKKTFPTVNPDKLPAVKEFLDKIAHTKEHKDDKLDFLVFKYQEDISKIVADEPAPQSKKTIETHRISGSNNRSVTVKDLADGTVGFQALEELDKSQRSQIVKDMDAKTYGKYVEYAKSKENEGGLTVMRNGKRINLK